MSINTSHIGDGIGVIIFNGECNLLYVPDIEMKMEYNVQYNAAFEEGYIPGGIYLTTHRMIFISRNNQSSLLSLNMPHVLLHNVKMKRELGKYPKLVGEIEAEPNGNFHGRLPFIFIFRKGGLVEFYEALASLAMHSAQAGRLWRPGGLFTSHFPHSPLYRAPKKVFFDVHKDPRFKFIHKHIAFVYPSNNQIYMHRELVPYPGFFQCESTINALNLAIPLTPDPRGLSKAYKNPTVYNIYRTPCTKPAKPGLVCFEETDFINHVQHYQGPYYFGPTAHKVSGECECKELKWENPAHCLNKEICKPIVNGIPVLCDKYTMIRMCKSDRPCHSNVYNKCE